MRKVRDRLRYVRKNKLPKILKEIKSLKDELKNVAKKKMSKLKSKLKKLSAEMKVIRAQESDLMKSLGSKECALKPQTFYYDKSVKRNK